jgi:hypothetical protein
MPTYINMGQYAPDHDEKDTYLPTVYIDNQVIQILNRDERFILEFTYEELRGIMAIMAAEQEKEHLFIRAQAKNN